MDNILWLLRHAASRVDRSQPISEWGLSEDGEHQIGEIVDTGLFDDVEAIFSSEEERAYQTARRVADRLQRDVIRIAGLNEVDRDAGGFLEDGEFERTIEFTHTHLDESRHGWETASHALSRFSSAIEGIELEHAGSTILVVSHGTVLALYFAKLMGRLDEVHGLWSRVDYCSYGIMKGGKVVKSIFEQSAFTAK